MKFKNTNLARGYIASGDFCGNRVPQHIQNQIVKLFCDQNDLSFVLSRAEYWINGSTDCQLWAALKEGFSHIVFYSLWQLPAHNSLRKDIYDYCFNYNITLHFAVERLSLAPEKNSFVDIEILMDSNRLISREINYDSHLEDLMRLCDD